MWQQTNALLFRTQASSTFRTKMGNQFKRTIKPNVHYQRLFSHVLNKELGTLAASDATTTSKANQKLGLKVSCWTLRTIDQCGGIDAFLLTTPMNKLQQSPLALKLRKEIIQKLKDTAKLDDTQLAFINKIQ